jgi:uncharacterized protein YfaS (alpha-2-macroglobulin family)
MKLRSALTLALLFCLTLTALPVYPRTPPTPPWARAQDQVEPDTDGLQFRLSEGTPPVERPTPVAPPPVITRMSDTAASRLLARLPALRPEPSETVSFQLRERSLPPPAIGKVLDAAFQPLLPSTPPVTASVATPLEVLRVAPEGEVELAPLLSITFSLPMVAVSSQEEAAAVVPVTLSPQPAGKWRWLGAQTLIFQPDAEGGRLPMATEYTVTIPAGTRSAMGNVLPAAKSFTFATPPPAIKRSYPAGNSLSRSPLMYLEFDQRIDPAQILDHLKLVPDVPGVRLRPATPDEIAANSYEEELKKAAVEGRWFAFRAVDATGATANVLPLATTMQVVLAEGAPSREGPRTTTKQQSFAFTTYGDLRIAQTRCGDGTRCSPYDRFDLDFSNSLDAANLPASKITISPEIPDVKISHYGTRISIEGAKHSNTTYTVTFDRSLKDEFGQTLTGDNQVKFAVTTVLPRFFSTDDGFLVLDPAVKRTYNIYTVNYAQIRVKLSRVTPQDWRAFRIFQLWRREHDVNIPLPTPPGTVVFDRVVNLTNRIDELSENAIDLSPALTNGYGQVFVQVEGVDEPNAPLQIYADGRNEPINAWVQATDIGLDAFVDHDRVIVWANSLHDGKPLPNVAVSVFPEGMSAATDTNGIANLAFDTPQKPDENNKLAVLVARRGDDVAILPQAYGRYYHNDGSSWRRSSGSSLSWYVFDDRKLYRPGEEVSIKGWIRTVEGTPHGDTGLFKAAGETVNYVLKDSLDNEIAKGTTTLNALAGFDLKLQLPPTMNLGNAEVEFELEQDTGEYTHRFQVQEFRRPEFEVKTEVSEGPHFIGTSATVTVTASYYTGGGLANADASWNVSSQSTNYTPPNRDDFVFGTFHPWWFGESYGSSNNNQSFTGKTDPNGRHTLRIDFDGVRPARPSLVSTAVRLEDVNRQGLTSYSSFIVHPAAVYVGIKTARTFVQPGQAFDLSSIVTDLDGKAVPGREVKLRLVRLDYVQEGVNWTQQETEVQEQTVQSGAEAVPVKFPTTKGGTYRLTAQVRDERERLNETELTLWVAGGKLPQKRGVEQEKVELIPSQKTYGNGDVAEVLVQAPFFPAEGVLTIRRSGLLRTERFTMTESTTTLRIPIEEAMTPNIHVQVDLVGTQTRADDDGKERPDLSARPAYASGELSLPVPPVTRRLKVTATPRDAMLEPGATTVVDVLVKDAAGKPVGGTDTAVIVVDESVLALANYELRDPLSVFYEDRDGGVGDFHLRERLKLASAQEVENRSYSTNITQESISELPINGRQFSQLYTIAPGTVNTSDGAYGNISFHGRNSELQVSLRSNFNALAIFAASVPTDARGRAQVRVKLPDNLTRYRVIAVSVAGGKFAGSGESAITARKQVMARPSAPRFLNFGDRAEFPVVVQNQTGKPIDVNLAARAINAELTDGAGRTVTVPANDRVEVRFPFAASLAGRARFQVVMEAGKLTDAAEVSFPVYTPATTEASATYGTIDQGSIAQPVKAPADAVRSFGGLEVTTASTQLQELTDAVIYLVNYPYDCSEQISSRILALAALKDVLTAFKSKDLPSQQEMQDSVAADIKRLKGLQNYDGGFDYWKHDEPSVPFVSVHVAHALIRAKQKGYVVPDEMLEDAKGYLNEIDKRIPKEYSAESRWAIRAYALYVRNLMEDPDPTDARTLIEDAGGVEKLSLESLGWILPVLGTDKDFAPQTDAVRRRINNRVTETAGAAHFADSYSDGAFTILASDRRTDGILLDALIGDQPQSDLIPKLVRGLLSGRKAGHWYNTQENVFILLALDRYFNTYEKTEPNFTARVWLGNGYAGEQTFRGRSIDKQQLSLPMATLADRTANGPANLTIQKDGPGRLYYRIGTRYAPANLNLAAADYGFRVERVYEAVDDPADVRHNADGTWHIRAGARVRVRVKMFNPARRYHVALVDPLPAGLEALNPELAGTETLPPDSADESGPQSGYYWYWRNIWYEHQNLRDDRVEAFTTMLWEGEHIYTYFARATTPGSFIVPPAKAEEMYSPETFGRGHTDRVRIE